VYTWPAALILIFVDRVGKGVRGSPRDAMMADSTPSKYMGKAFGFHRSMDTLGAAVGPLLAYIILLVTSGNIRAVFAWTIIPGILSVLVILFFLREKKPKAEEAAVTEVKPAEPKLKPAIKASQLGTRFWMFTTISTVFAI